jgi:periplasmic divalent cation tolerance protein
VTLKTTTTRYAELEAHLLAGHPWDNPEVSAIEISHGSRSYLAWLDSSTNP